jgi:starch synthase
MTSVAGQPPAISVMHAAAEVYPLLKTGGLADVVGALPPALRAQGIDVRLLLPGAPPILAGLADLRTVAAIGPAFGAARITLRLGRIPGGDVPAYVLDAPWLYDRPGNPYLAPDGAEWRDNQRRFAAFGWAAAHLAFGELDPAWRPGILHCHDWHCGLAPAYLRAHPAAGVRTVFTIHNLAYQGGYPLADFRGIGLPDAMLQAEGLEFHGRGNFMKAGLVFSDWLTTVSPRYAREICTHEFGAGMEGVLAARRQRLTGILNGVDYAVWDPATDPHLATNYDANRLEGKARCKAALQADSGLEQAARMPLFAVVSRLADQKGTDLLLAALPGLLQRGGQLVVLGSGDRQLEEALEAAARAYPGRVAVTVGYDEARAHRIIAGADLIVLPSRFEPCGLTQMYGLRYGTLPLVRRVGGLADTVTDADEVPSTSATGESATKDPTGFVFDRPGAGALEETIARAIEIYAHQARWEAMMRAAMSRDHSWSSAGARYAELYRGLVAEAGPGPEVVARMLP